MAFSYMLSTAIGRVRLLIPDNDADAYDLQDEEIQYFLDRVSGNVHVAAITACKWLARKYAKRVSFTADGFSAHLQERAREFAARATELEAELLGGITSVAIEREDGYSATAGTSEYQG